MWTSVTFLLGQILINRYYLVRSWSSWDRSRLKKEKSLTTGMLQLGRRSAQKLQPGSFQLQLTRWNTDVVSVTFFTFFLCTFLHCIFCPLHISLFLRVYPQGLTCFAGFSMYSSAELQCPGQKSGIRVDVWSWILWQEIRSRASLLPARPIGLPLPNRRSH